MENATKNYQKHEEIMQKLKAIHVDVDTYTAIKAMELLGQLVTDKFCPHCDRRLLLSDLKQYDYVCPECDENFYSVECGEEMK